MALLTYVWRTASTSELGGVRAAIDMQVAPLVAAEVRNRPPNRLPRTLGDINFFAHERSMCRLSDPRTFLRADLAFHRAVVASVRGLEIGPALYERVGERLMDALMPVADVQAGNPQLDEAHLRLARMILAGDVRATARCARRVALDEVESLDTTLG
jgi:DNA-binding FadR family transcriptional regulator